MSQMIHIAEYSNDPKVPFENLMPILRALVAGGNRVRETGFRLDPGGWRCLMVDPIDGEIIAAQFALPPSITFSAKFDTVFDRLSWCGIEGPGAARYRTVGGG